MKHLLILFFLLTTNAFAQGPFGDYAVVKDKDGYVNIRAKESVKSKIVGTLPNNTLVYGFFDKEYNPTNWIEVDKGYVHQSRLKRIFDFRAIEGKEQGNSIIFDDKDVKVTITKQKFDKTKHKITKKEHDGWTELIIDGKKMYGIEDELLPDDHYKSITVTMKDKTYLFLKVLMMIYIKFSILTDSYSMMRKLRHFTFLRTIAMLVGLT